MTSYTVTATQGTNTAAGMFLYVLVLTNAQMAGTPSAGSSVSAYNCAVTATVAGSMVVGAIAQGAASAFTAEANSTITNYADSTHGNEYAGFYSSATSGSGSAAYGSSTAYANGWYGCAAVEIIPVSGGNVTLDGSGPVSLGSGTLTALTSASFTPPAGSLLVALVATNGATSSMAAGFSFSSSPSLTWTLQSSETAQSSSTYYGWTGVATAAVPGGGGTDTSPAYAATATDLGGGTGSWTSPANAEGAADGSFATWTAP